MSPTFKNTTVPGFLGRAPSAIIPPMTFALSWALVAGCAAITDAELAERMDRDGDGDVAVQWGGTDCDDDDPARNDKAVEICNGFDDDCSGSVDDVRAPEGETFYLDLDHDGAGGDAVQACDQPNETVRTGGVTIIAPLNVPATMPNHASLLFSRNLTAFVLAFTQDKAFRLDLADDIQQGAVITFDGEVKHGRTREALLRERPQEETP